MPDLYYPALPFIPAHFPRSMVGLPQKYVDVGKLGRKSGEVWYRYSGTESDGYSRTGIVTDDG
jgi:3-hydroxyacyl-CoA dehydrogenase